MQLVRDHIAVKLAAAALAFLATFAAVRAIDAGAPSVGLDRGSLHEDAQSYVELGQAYLTRFGETEDPFLYPKAERAFQAAIELDPADASAVAGMAQLELSKHWFRRGLALAEEARRL